jgi:hypothetical protein
MNSLRAEEESTRGRTGNQKAENTKGQIHFITKTDPQRRF